jgi:hypothetical protein
MYLPLSCVIVYCREITGACKALNGTSENRKDRRYDVSEYVKDNYISNISLEINTGTVISPQLTDISINGFGIVLEEAGSSMNLDEFNKLNDYFIHIHFINKVILAEVKKIWSIITEESGKKFLKGGFSFSVISPEDRLSLAEFIASQRE